MIDTKDGIMGLLRALQGLDAPSAPGPKPLPYAKPQRRLLDKCESPPEELMLKALAKLGDVERHQDTLAITTPDLVIKVTPQYQTMGRRLDFAVVANGVHLAVEVDGWQWHHFTKELSANTALRTRDLSQLGWVVLPFAAIEVFGDADQCAQDVVAALKAHIADRQAK